MKKNRPLNINPLTIKLPIPALVSISHRLSGVFIFMLIPWLLWMLSQSLATEQSYLALKSYFESVGLRFLLWILLVGICFHLIAGLRHLLMDCHLGDSLKAGRMGSYLVILFTLIFAIVTALCLGSFS